MMAMKKEKPVGDQTALARFLANTAGGAVGGALGSHPSRMGMGAGMGALSGAAGTGIAEASGLRRGGVGYDALEGGTSMGLLGAGLAGKIPGGNNLIHFLMQKHGLSKGKAIAAVLATAGGIGGAFGAGIGGIHGAIDEHAENRMQNGVR